MKRVVYSAQAFSDLERLTEFLLAHDAGVVEERIRSVLSAVEFLAANPFIGRPVRDELRELVISYGRSGYVAMYRVVANRVEVLSIRHQREAGYG